MSHLPYDYRGDRRPQTVNQLNARLKPNALRNVQVLPPYRVDLTLSPTTLDQIQVPPRPGRDH